MMGAQFGGVAFVVWRESVEALLVIGILDSWLAGRSADTGRGRRFLWGGVVLGLIAAGLLAVVLTTLGDALSEDALGAYQTVTVLIACALILRMLAWMRRHARDMRRDLETAAEESTGKSGWWGVLVLALIAVAREGSETVVFLYGMLSSAVPGGSGGAVLGGGVGLAGALLTYGAMRLAGTRVPWRLFFRATEIMLLFLACALLMSGVDGLIDLGILPKLTRGLWSTSGILSDAGPGGGFLASLTGYRARPNLTELLVFVLYWLGVWGFLLRPRAPACREATA